MNNPIQKMKPKPPVEFTIARKEQFLKHLRETGLKYVSAELAGVSDRTVVDHQKNDPEFAALVETAKQHWIDNVLVREAVRRATKGVQKPIIGGKFKDEIVAHETVYSDSLMALLLRSQREEFRDGAGAGGTQAGFTPGPLIVPTAPMTMDGWEAQHGEAAKGTTGKPAK